MKNDVKYINIKGKDHLFKGFYKIKQEKWLNKRNQIIDIISSPEQIKILDKIAQNSINLQDQYDVRVGLQAYEKGKGKPKQTEYDVENHVFDYQYKYDENTYKYLNGKDINRYYLDWSGQWLRYGEWLSQPKTFDQFSEPRILIREITSKAPYVLVATYTDDIYLNNKSILNILEKNNNESLLYFLLGYLNSKLVSFYHIRQTVKGNRGLFPKIVIRDLKNYPLPINFRDSKLIVSKVDQILQQKQQEPTADTSALESEIDEMVYDLYGLTVEERKIVEEGVGPARTTPNP